EQRRSADAERHVDVEDPTPSERAHDEPAEQRTDQTGDAPHRAEHALHLRALLDVVGVADDGARDRLHAARADALHRASRAYLRHRARLPTRHRADEAEHDGY